MMRFYGYKHWTLENPPRCFYVGKGLIKRANSRRSRNHKWHAIVKRYGLRVDVCFGPVTNEEACTWEIEQIEKENTFNVNHSHEEQLNIGCNITKGGEGVVGHRHAPGSLNHHGQRNPMFGRRGSDNPNFGSRRKENDHMSMW